MSIKKTIHLLSTGTLLLTSIACFGMNKDVDPETVKILNTHCPTSEKKQTVIIGAAHRCDKEWVASAFESLKGHDKDSQLAQAALAEAINNCTTHENGPAIIDHLANNGVNLNEPIEGMRPVAQASALAKKNCHYTLLERMLNRGANPLLENKPYPNQPALSTLQVHEINQKFGERSQCNQEVINRLKEAARRADKKNINMNNFK